MLDKNKGSCLSFSMEEARKRDCKYVEVTMDLMVTIRSNTRSETERYGKVGGILPSVHLTEPLGLLPHDFLVG